MTKKKIIVEKFDSLSEYVSVIGGRPVNDVFKGRKLSSEKKGTSGFAATATYEESIALMERGYSEGLEKMLEIGCDVRVRSMSIRSLPSSAPVGYAPIVPNAILGLPNSMMSRKTVRMKTKALSIWYDVTADSGVSAKDMMKVGRKLLEIINNLELKGYRVELRVAASFCCGDEIAITSVKVKTDRQPMNPLKIAYPILHASFLRRQGFKWLEGTPELADSGFAIAYGRPLRHSDVGGSGDARRKFLRDNKVVPDNVFYTDFYETMNMNAQGIMNHMGIK